MPQYSISVWELHPLVVSAAHRHKGIDSALVAALEAQLKQKGCLTIYLGTDDETGATSLSNTDLFQDTFEKITHIKNLKHHPFAFCQKNGYQIIGVIPDANGVEKPNIFMGKNLLNL